MSRIYSAKEKALNYEGILASKSLEKYKEESCHLGTKSVRIVFDTELDYIHKQIIVLLTDTIIEESSESFILDQSRISAILHYLDPISQRTENIELKFNSLKKKWENETALFSSIEDIVMHPAYQQIIGMGRKVLPLIFEELKRKPGLWFWALKSITGTDPVSPNDRGRIVNMSNAWLSWGKEHGYI